MKGNERRDVTQCTCYFNEGTSKAHLDKSRWAITLFKSDTTHLFRPIYSEIAANSGISDRNRPIQRRYIYCSGVRFDAILLLDGCEKWSHRRLFRLSGRRRSRVSGAADYCCCECYWWSCARHYRGYRCVHLIRSWIGKPWFVTPLQHFRSYCLILHGSLRFGCRL